jgi:uroporphyrinogen III methyltransferase/synthase
VKSNGRVFLVGAGPGDAGLITVRGAELLGRAEVVVYDALVNLDLLRLAPPGAELIYAGKRSGDHAIPQDKLNQLLVEKARAGKCVVRLKGGDPYVFGRGGEEAGELAAADVRFEVVPGVSSSIAGPNYAGIPVTHRDHCSSFTVVTGHEDPDKEEPEVDWAEVARAPGTKVVLMGVKRVKMISDALIANGMAPDTPAAMIRLATTGRQKSIVGTLQTMADVAEKADFKPPGLMVIGTVVNLRGQLSWFERRSLFGRRIVVTRTREGASQLARQLLERGADVLEIPTIRTVPPTERQLIADALLELNAYDWLVFTSPNGVSAFFEMFFKAFEDLRDIGGVRLAAVGPVTAAKLRELHLKVDAVPEEFTASKVAAAMAELGSIENLRILLARAEVANPDLPKHLMELGAIVDDIPCYKTVPETEDRNGAAERLLEMGADWITFTSSSTVENFHARFDLKQLLERYPTIKLASIGPETSKAIVTLGFKPEIEAREHTPTGLVKALEAAEKK